MRLEHHLVGGYVRYISPHIIIIIIIIKPYNGRFCKMGAMMIKIVRSSYQLRICKTQQGLRCYPATYRLQSGTSCRYGSIGAPARTSAVFLVDPDGSRLISEDLPLKTEHLDLVLVAVEFHEKVLRSTWGLGAIPMRSFQLDIWHVVYIC